MWVWQHLMEDVEASTSLVLSVVYKNHWWNNIALIQTGQDANTITFLLALTYFLQSICINKLENEGWKSPGKIHWYLFNLVFKFFISVFLAATLRFCKGNHVTSYETARHPLEPILLDFKPPWSLYRGYRTSTSYCSAASDSSLLLANIPKSVTGWPAPSWTSPAGLGLQGERFLLAPEQTSSTRIATDCWRFLKALLNYAIIKEFIGHLVPIPVSWLKPSPEELHCLPKFFLLSVCLLFPVLQGIPCSLGMACMLQKVFQWREGERELQEK